MISVNTNNSAMAALQSLSQTQNSLAMTQNAISTGKVVANSSDNPAVYSIANTMQSQVSGLTAVSASLTFGAAVLTTAQTAQSNIATVLQNLQQTITQGQTTGMTTAVMNNEITQALDQINTFAQSATMNKINLVATSPSDTTATSTMNIVTNITGTTLSASLLDVSGSATTASDITGLGLAGLTVSSGGVSIATDSTTLPVTGNSLTLTNGTNTYTYLLNDGVAAPSFSVGSSATQINRVVQITTGESAAGVFAALGTSMAQDGFSGSTDSTGTFNITGNSVSATSSVSTIAGATTIGSITSVTGAIATVVAAITQLGLNSSAIGAALNQVTGMEAFTSSLSDSLTSGIGALTDANMAAESAKLTSLQTKQSLAIQSLSIANQQPQSIMTLFR